MKYPLPHVILT